MKKRVLGIVVVILLMSMLGVLLTSCVGKQELFEPDFMGAENLIEGASIISERKAKGEKADAKHLLEDNNKCWTPQYIGGNSADGEYGGSNACVDIQLKDTYTFNTALIREVGENVLYFRLQAWVNGEWQTVYRSEKIQEMRLITFREVTTDKIRLSIDKFRDKKAKIKSIELYNVAKRSADDFNVTVYQRLDVKGAKPTDILQRSEEEQKTYARYYDVYNTVLIFGAVNWDENGNLVYGGEGATNEERKANFDAEIKALKQLVDMRTNRHEVKIIITALADGAGGGHNGVNKLMADNYEGMAEKMVNTFIKSEAEGGYGLDGLDIDWEYPQNKQDWQCYDKFMKVLHDKMTAVNEDSIISAALSAWHLGMKPETLDLIDQVQYMAYDDMDRDGQQSTLHKAQMGVAELVEAGISLDRINIGIPSYGRPLDGTLYWPEWKDQHNANYFENKYYNVECDTDLFDATFCSPAMAGDKTAYALFAGVGGVMVFRLNCDKLMSDPNAVACGIEDTLMRYVDGWWQ